MTLYDLKEFAKKRSRITRVKANGYQTWLSYLKPFNFFLVTGAAVLSLLAGSTLLYDDKLLGPMVTGLMALAAGIFTIIHQTLKCDAHQEECRKLFGSYDAIAEQFSNLKLEDSQDIVRKKIDELNSQLINLTQNYSAKPPLWIVKREEKKDKNRF